VDGAMRGPPVVSIVSRFQCKRGENLARRSKQGGALRENGRWIRLDPQLVPVAIAAPDVEMPWKTPSTRALSAVGYGHYRLI
jgi:hypothetical protein